MTPGTPSQCGPGVPAVPSPELRRRLSHKLVGDVAQDAVTDRDWDTIDWTYDSEAFIEHQIHERDQSLCYTFQTRVLSWWVIIVTASCTGLIAGFVDLTSSLLGSWRSGWCTDMWWLSQGLCCPGLYTNAVPCPQWTSWDDYFPNVPFAGFMAYVGLSVVYGLACVWMVLEYAPYAAGSGIAEIKTILSGVKIRDYLGELTLFVKSLGLCFSVGSGLSLGKEGPFVHVATCVGNIVAGIYHDRMFEPQRREVLSASCAAGVAVAFSAPIGGVLFSLEEASTYFPHRTMWRTLFCAVVATLVLRSIDPTGNGTLAMLAIDYKHQWYWFELVPFCVLGVAGGILGSLFNHLNVQWMLYKRSSGIVDHPVREIFVLSVVTAVLNYNVQFMKMSATDAISEMFAECRPGERGEVLCDPRNEESLHYHLLLAAAVKFILTIFTFGIKVPCGLFVPSLFTGACLGRLVGMYVNLLYHTFPDYFLFSECDPPPGQSCVVPGVYALVGAAALLGGVTRKNFSLVAIIAELTAGIEYVSPVILAALVSKWTAEAFGGGKSIFDLYILLNGYPFLDPRQEVGTLQCVGDVLNKPTQEFRVLRDRGLTIGQVNDILAAMPFKGFPVVDADQRVVGWALRKRLAEVVVKALDVGAEAGVGPQTEIVFSPEEVEESTEVKVDASWFVDFTPIQIAPQASANRLLHMFKTMGLRSIVVSDNGVFVGVITRKDILEYLQEEDERSALITQFGAFAKMKGGREGKQAAKTGPAQVLKTPVAAALQPQRDGSVGPRKNDPKGKPAPEEKKKQMSLPRLPLLPSLRLDSAPRKPAPTAPPPAGPREHILPAKPRQEKRPAAPPPRRPGRSTFKAKVNSLRPD